MNAFEDYSKRALQVLFIARLRATQVGAQVLDIDHLLWALVVEDQGGDAMKGLFGTPITPDHSISQKSFNAKSHDSFLASEIAAKGVAQISNELPKLASVPATADMPTSDSLGRVLERAKVLAANLGQPRIHPLHLLAAVLTEPEVRGVKVLLDNGVSPQKALDAIP